MNNIYIMKKVLQIFIVFVKKIKFIKKILKTKLYRKTLRTLHKIVRDISIHIVF